ncbi:MAG TPA: ATP-dependent Clp protease ATP-binding subunit ClpA, partial [Candidatus Hydrogenedentes bacterium]|nr:ATP-dependent Clp protease ATP-binding subunit ClpA [Candidatus Hydrogenedentota bacterium]
MISRELRITLGHAVRVAREWRHEYLCVEHLLFAILEDNYGRDVLINCGADIDRLRHHIEDFFEDHLESLPPGEGGDVQKTVAFQRVLHRAHAHVQHSS